MVSEGCIISGGRVDRSILGLRVRVNSFSDVAESILFDDVEVGRHARIRRAIIDKGVRVPARRRDRIRPRRRSSSLHRERGRGGRRAEGDVARLTARALSRRSRARYCSGPWRREQRGPWLTTAAVLLGVLAISNGAQAVGDRRRSNRVRVPGGTPARHLEYDPRSGLRRVPGGVRGRGCGRCGASPCRWRGSTRDTCCSTCCCVRYRTPQPIGLERQGGDLRNRVRDRRAGIHVRDGRVPCPSARRSCRDGIRDRDRRRADAERPDRARRHDRRGTGGGGAGLRRDHDAGPLRVRGDGRAPARDTRLRPVHGDGHARAADVAGEAREPRGVHALPPSGHARAALRAGGRGERRTRRRGHRRRVDAGGSSR